jgi:hypothetical protein
MKKRSVEVSEVSGERVTVAAAAPLPSSQKYARGINIGGQR